VVLVVVILNLCFSFEILNGPLALAYGGPVVVLS
jgi:hypothetical protein